MIQRLLSNRINAEPAAASIGGQHNPVAAVLPHKTKPPLPLVEFAHTRTNVALDAAVFQPVPPLAGNHTRLNQLSRWSAHKSFSEEHCQQNGPADHSILPAGVDEPPG